MTTRVRIRALAHGGAGVGTAVEGEGPTWFVAGALPGEIVDAEVEHQAKRYVRGRLVEVVDASDLRAPAPCGIADLCGGCNWQHVRAKDQPELKCRIVADQLRAAVPNLQVRLAYRSEPTAYRRRVRMHYRRGDGFELGFLAERSHELVDVEHCPVLVPALDQAMQRLRAFAHLLPHEGEALGLTDGREVVLGLPGVRPEPERMQALAPLVQAPIVGVEVRGGRQAGGVGRVHLELDPAPGLPPVRCSAFSFAQAQGAGNLALVREVVRAARPEGKKVLELYAGAGNFTRALARSAARVWASDTDRDAVELLRGLARAHDLPINAKRQNATRLLPKLSQADVRYDVVVLDPPRAGLGEEATRALCRVAAERIVYVSCDPATLARDLRVACEHGFRVLEVAAFDLMPMTSQVEMVATLARGGRRGGGA